MTIATELVRQALRAYIGGGMEVATLEDPGPSLLLELEAARVRCLGLVAAFLAGPPPVDDRDGR